MDSSATGFTVRTTLNIQAAPGDVYRRLVHNIGDWWNPAHTFSGDAHNLSIEEKAMGCFCEKLPGWRRGPPPRGRLRGARQATRALRRSRLQGIAATGSMILQFSGAEAGSKLDMTYAVTGYLPAGLNTWAAPVDTVLKEQFTRLKNYIEHGNPAPKPQ